MRAISAAMHDVAAMPRGKCVTPLYSAKVSLCTFGAEAAPIDVVLFGDSHALQWFNAVEHVARRK
jgi:hypothetical protein